MLATVFRGDPGPAMRGCMIVNAVTELGGRDAGVRQAGRRCAAFAWNGPDEEEFLVVLWEAPSGDGARAGAVSADIRRELRDRLGLTAVEVSAVPPASIPFTSSGKVKRAQARLMWPEVPQSVPSAARAAAPEPGDES